MTVTQGSGATRRIDVFLQPGEHFVGDARHRVHTLLGSCVSITLWHPARRIGAMSHFLLANPAVPSRTGLDSRYGTQALAMMTSRLAQRGVPLGGCEAKLFGGGNMFPDQVRDPAQHVGRRNGEEARELLAGLGLAVVSESLFGAGHRRIRFDIATGSVWERRCATTAGATS